MTCHNKLHLHALSKIPHFFWTSPENLIVQWRRLEYFPLDLTSLYSYQLKTLHSFSLTWPRKRNQVRSERVAKDILGDETIRANKAEGKKTRQAPRYASSARLTRVGFVPPSTPLLLIRFLPEPHSGYKGLEYRQRARCRMLRSRLRT